MALRFEDHRGFERACLAASATGAAAAYWAASLGPPWAVQAWSAAGAVVAVAIVVAAAGELPPPGCIAASVGLALVALAAAPSLNALVAVLDPALSTRAAAAAAGGAVLGLWLGTATVPLHLRAGRDRVEQRLAELRTRVAPDLLDVAQRAAAARADLLDAAPEDLRPRLRRAIDRVVLEALALAEQGGEDSRTAMLERVAELERARSALAPLQGGA